MAIQQGGGRSSGGGFGCDAELFCRRQQRGQQQQQHKQHIAYARFSVTCCLCACACAHLHTLHSPPLGVQYIILQHTLYSVCNAYIFNIYKTVCIWIWICSTQTHIHTNHIHMFQRTTTRRRRRWRSRRRAVVVVVVVVVLASMLAAQPHTGVGKMALQYGVWLDERARARLESLNIHAPHTRHGVLRKVCLVCLWLWLTGCRPWLCGEC